MLDGVYENCKDKKPHCSMKDWCYPKKEAVLELAKEGQTLKEGKDLVKDPFVLEFLGMKENTNYLETDLEKNILAHLKEFLLELEKGFMFVGS